MARRGKGLLTDELLQILTMVPWWVGPILAGITFLVFRFLLPAVFQPNSADPMSKGMGLTLSIFAYQAAPWVGLFVVAVWVAAEVRKWQRRRLVDKQSGIDSIRNLSWREFEDLVGEAYRRQGFMVEFTGDPSGDGGVDLVLTKAGQTILVQCKQWKAFDVGVKPVRELLGVVASRKAHRGILVTSGRFTQGAVRFAEANPIELLDGPPLAKMIAGVQAGLTAQAPASQTPVVSRPAPAVAPAASAPLCPICNSSMARRTANKGPNAGKPFWGCSGYPRCRGTRNIA